MNATAKDLRFHSSELLETVTRGEEVVITRHGKPCAKLVPFPAMVPQAEKNQLFGIWRENDDTQNVDEYVRKLRKSRF